MISRRNFLKNTAVASAVVVSLPEMIVSARKVDEPINVLIKRKLVLFQGDSITDSGRSKTDVGATMGQGFPVLISCRLAADFPNQRLKFLNRGIAGHTIVDLANRWQTDTIDHNPDIVSILIGINDVSNFIGGNKNTSADHFEKDYISIIEKTMKSLPITKMVLCEPFAFPIGLIKNQEERYMKEVAIRQEIVKKLAASFQAIYVPLQEPLEKAAQKSSIEYWVYDGVHPTFAGHEIIAREWLKGTQLLFV